MASGGTNIDFTAIPLANGLSLANYRQPGYYIVKDPADGPVSGTFHLIVAVAVSNGVRYIMQHVWHAATGVQYTRMDNGNWVNTGGGGPGSVTAAGVSINPSGTSLTGTNVQTALVGIVTRLDQLDLDMATLASLVTNINNALGTKADLAYVNQQLALKADITYVDMQDSSLDSRIDALEATDGQFPWQQTAW